MSGFKNILKTHKEAREHPEEAAVAPSPAPEEAARVEAPSPPKRAPSKPAEAPKKRGRPNGKRSDRDYNQVTAYIRRETHLGVQMHLLKDGKTKDFSELVEELLSKWLRSRT